MLHPDFWHGSLLRDDIRTRILSQINAAGLEDNQYSAYLVGDLVSHKSKLYSPFQVVVSIDSMSAKDFNDQIGKYLQNIEFPELERKCEFVFQNGLIDIGKHNSVYDIRHKVWFKGNPSEKVAKCKKKTKTEIEKERQEKNRKLIDEALKRYNPGVNVTARSASAFLLDSKFSELPKSTQDDIKQFAECAKDTLIPTFGMVVSELLPKADPHNLESAQDHVKDTSKSKLEKEIYDKSDTKYVLLVNDRIVDGHHYLAKAERAAVTRALRVLDLTACRFQKKEAALEGAQEWVKKLHTGDYRSMNDWAKAVPEEIVPQIRQIAIDEMAAIEVEQANLRKTTKGEEFKSQNAQMCYRSKVWHNVLLYMSDRFRKGQNYIGGRIPDNPRLPIFTTTERPGAEWYAKERGGDVHQVQIEAKNPLRLASEADVVNNLLPVMDAVGVRYKFTPSTEKIGWYLEVPEVSKHSPYEGENPLDVAYIPRVRAELVKRGYDSISASDVLNDLGEIPVTVLIKQPEQLRKLPLSNRNAGWWHEHASRQPTTPLNDEDWNRTRQLTQKAKDIVEGEKSPEQRLREIMGDVYTEDNKPALIEIRDSFHQNLITFEQAVRAVLDLGAQRQSKYALSNKTASLLV